MIVYLLRHTSLKIKPNVLYGQSDIDVSENFLKEVVEIKKKIDGLNINLTNLDVYSSPLIRCVKLASEIFKPFKKDQRLKELNFGDWEMNDISELPKEEVEKWKNSLMEFQIPNGESNLIFFNRLKSFCDYVLNFERNVFVVAHAGSINCIISYLTNIPFKDLIDENWKKIKYGSLTILERKEKKFKIKSFGI